MASEKTISFAPMISIKKESTAREIQCSDWIATEKVHGSSFQFYTSDGENVHMGSRVRSLDGHVTFLKCNLAEFHQRYLIHVQRVFQAVITEKRWQSYKRSAEKDDGGESESDGEATATREENDQSEQNVASDSDAAETNNNYNDRKINTSAKNEGNDHEEIGAKADNVSYPENAIEVHVRIYGELYGGGGVTKDIKHAVQKEIIYSDDFRFYVFGITINRMWVSISEMNDLCKIAGFPHFATPVCEPKSTLEDLKEFLSNSGFMNSRSRLTDRNDDYKTNIEGVVMSPLTRPDSRSHAIKLLSAAFTDIRRVGKGKNMKVNYCTKARYLSVISKLDIPERKDAELVITMFVEDIKKESGEEISINKSKGCARAVRNWLTKDGYCENLYEKFDALSLPRVDETSTISPDTTIQEAANDSERLESPVCDHGFDVDINDTECEEADFGFAHFFDT
ncbi:hypothetical protein PoB_000868400 [Plakobranchus ocellatus]|uniref:RNA ligase domain-containing protein n=1 Tax=Plakobranchus ocellatus TaxID=259542 RepID=A0AAV3YJG4_9GAST|nr:hypothetical protein PoB_000868400 [Plakobranchus ocellatus]